MRFIPFFAGLALGSALLAQGPPVGAPKPPPTPRAGAPVDFTGTWVSVVTEDWRWRMVTPIKGDFASMPVNGEARRIGNAWDPAPPIPPLARRAKPTERPL